jgi:hypothetical protein
MGYEKGINIGNAQAKLGKSMTGSAAAVDHEMIISLHYQEVRLIVRFGKGAAYSGKKKRQLTFIRELKRWRERSTLHILIFGGSGA